MLAPVETGPRLVHIHIRITNVQPAHSVGSRRESSLQDTLWRLTEASSSEDSAHAILLGCTALVPDSQGRVYLLELNDGARFVPFVTVRTDSPADHVDHPMTGKHAGSFSDIQKAILSGETMVIVNDGASAFRSSLIIPVKRASTCIAILQLQAHESEAFDHDTVATIRSLSNLLSTTYDQRRVFTLLSEGQHPIDFRIAQQDFLDSVTRLIARASGMQFIALRELDDDRNLRCLALRGFGEDVDIREWDIANLAKNRLFERAVAGTTSICRAMRTDPDCSALCERKELENVRSFVATPVKVGAGVFGVLSFAAGCEYDYSSVEVLGFESLANSVGIAITNYRNFHAAGADLAHHSEVAISITGLEIAQAARHEAKDVIDECQFRIANIQSRPDRRVHESKDEFSKLGEDLRGIKTVLDKIKTATRPPTREISQVSLKDLWHQARSLVAGRLNALKIDADYEGPELIVEVYPDWFRQVFLNLMTNSIDAFQESRQKRGRRIWLSVEKSSDKVLFHSMRYSDNATGIEPTMLTVPSKYETLPLQQQIFQPNVTSKADGSGYGLVLVRKILADHSGSIDLVSHRGGVSFAIQISKELEK